MIFSLAQIDPTLPIRDTELIYSTISSSFDQITIDLLTKKGIFTALTNYAQVIAVGSLSFFLLQWIKKMVSGQEAMSQMVWPLVVVYLLSGGGKPLATICLTAREVQIEIVQGVLNQTVNGLKLQDGMQQALAQGAAAQFDALAQRACADQPEGLRTQCLERYDAQLKQQLQKLKTEKNQSWYTGISRYFSLKKLKESIVGQVSLTALQGAISAIFYGFATAFVWLLETLLIIILVTSPIAVGFSLLPRTGQLLSVWVSGFIGVSVGKIGLVAANAIAASVFISTEANLNTLLLPIFMALCAPIIAGTLIAISGGGAFFSIAAGPIALMSWIRGVRGGR